MGRHPDGSTISSYFGTEKMPSGSDVYDGGLRFTYGQIDKIHFVDEDSNISKKFVEYDVSIRDAKGGQSTLRNIRSMSSLFGANDFEETILESNEFASKGKLDSSNFFKNKNGTIVVIAHMHGSNDKPFIVGTWQHPAFSKGATKADGIRKKGEYRGIQWEINKDGEFILTYLGNRTPDGKLAREDTGPTEVKIDKDGVFTLADNEDQKFEMNRKTKTFTFTNGVTVTYDGEKDKVTIETTGGAKVEVDGDGDKITAETTGGAKVEIDGSADTVDALTAGGTEVKLDGTADKIEMKTSAGAEASIDGTGDAIKLVTSGTGELNIVNNTVALGSSTAELLQQISDQLQQLITVSTAEAAHTHNIITPIPGNPTGPPTTAGGWIAAAAQFTIIKALIESIKGTL